ncbi:MAG: hypothetical protein JWO51_1595 [Rhodospirillales bacterium]|nr:hypothetical protein [Rhodospirillales bacterium]
MPYDRTDPRDELSDERTELATAAEPGEDELATALAALFSMFGGQVLDSTPRD